MPNGKISRRLVLQLSSVLAAASALAPVSAQAQNAEVARLQRARRILLKGGIVLTLDRNLGDFASADVLIEDGKIRDIRPNLVASADTILVDATNRIVIPGFIDTHVHSYQGLLRSTLPNGLVDPDYNRDIQNSM